MRDILYSNNYIFFLDPKVHVHFTMQNTFSPSPRVPIVFPHLLVLGMEPRALGMLSKYSTT
jgi:hypothetical protein